jgi:hypothetical protein
MVTAPKTVKVEGILHRRSGDYSDKVPCERFFVSKGVILNPEGIEVSFPNRSFPGQSVSLVFDSSKTAAAIAHALLSVTDGCVSKVEGTFE